MEEIYAFFITPSHDWKIYIVVYIRGITFESSKSQGHPSENQKRIHIIN